MKNKKFLYGAISIIVVLMLMSTGVSKVQNSKIVAEKIEDENECIPCQGRDGEEDDFVTVVCPMISSTINDIITSYESTGIIETTSLTQSLQMNTLDSQRYMDDYILDTIDFTNPFFDFVYNIQENHDIIQENHDTLLYHTLLPKQSNDITKINNNDDFLTEEMIYQRALGLRDFCDYLSGGEIAEDYSNGFFASWFGNNGDMPSPGSCGVGNNIGYFAAVLACSAVFVGTLAIPVFMVSQILAYLSMTTHVSLNALIGMLAICYAIVYEDAVIFANQIYNAYHNCIDTLSSIYC